MGAKSLDGRLLVNLGVAMAFAGEDALAGRRFRQALVVDPGSTAAASGMLPSVGSAKAQGPAGSAMCLLGTGEDWRRLGRAFARAGRVEDAIAALGRAVRLAPERADWAEEMAFLLWGSFRGEEAVDCLARIGSARHLVTALEWAFQDTLDATVETANSGYRQALDLIERILSMPSSGPEADSIKAGLKQEPAVSQLRGAPVPSGGKDGREHYRLVPNAGSAAGENPSADAIDRALRVHYLKDAELLSGEWLVLRNDGTAIADSCVSFLRPEKRGYLTRLSLGWLSITRPEKTVRSDGKAVLLGYYPNYYHWMIDYLPRLLGILSAPALADRKIVLASGLERYAFETVGKLGIGPERVFTLDSPVSLRAADLAMVDFGPRPLTKAGSPVFYCGSQPAEVIAALRERLLRLYGCRAAEKGTRRIFISRRDSKSPRILNEGEIWTVLAQQGFEEVSLTGKSVAEQIELFADVEIVVGGHGAGLTNALFVPKGAHIVELHDRTRSLDFFEKVARAVGARHHRVPSRRTYLDETSRLGNRYEIAPEQVLQVVTYCLKN
ncbi:glycosyltransferase 61 family protein [Nisaea acidiphila]|uniref:Glycosyltransferase 61 family protein n=1 Tax=Nisaea acidiphila TaxID=1862145 RepID=A0A9J7AS05_9PROT|nr:glycosyltransferase 61 family protein [Nisaea acidiphila]UUX49650.1 glycosyltransferase 61 family protein [Nisaea acidiphila]